MTEAPETIWIVGAARVTASMEWRGAPYPLAGWDTKYVRADLIDARIAEAVAAEMAEADHLCDMLASCVAMIQHAIGQGNDVFIEPDTKRKLSDARAAIRARQP